MKKLVLLASLIIFLLNATAQTLDWVWARGAQSPTHLGEGTNIATDRTDNVFLTGYYWDSIIFGSDTLSNPSPHNTVYLVKYDPCGNVLWAKGALGGGNSSSFGSSGNCVATDKFGNSFITGYLADTISFGSHTLISGGQSDPDIFLVKYDPSGNVLWAKRAGGTGQDFGRGVATDASGNVYLTGTYLSSVFTIGSFNLSGGDFFLAKYDSSGNVLWAKGPSNGFAGGYSVATDVNANIFLTGWFGSTLTIGTHTITGPGGNNVLLAKFDSSGNALWLNGSSGNSGGFGSSVSIDASNNAYITGYHSNASISFGTFTLTNTSSSSSYNDGFLTKYNSSGNVVWAKNIAGAGDDKCYSVAADKSGKVYITGGSFQLSSPLMIFDTVSLPLVSGEPMFLACYDSSGSALFAKALANGGDDQNAVAASHSGCVFIGGDFGAYSFIVGKDTLNSINPEEPFIAKLCASPITADFTSSDTAFCTESGKCISFFDHSTCNITSWQWHFNGAVPNASWLQNPDSICYSAPGTYAVSLIVSNGSLYDTLTVASMIIVGSAPSPPVITVVGGDTLYCSHGSSYQWFLNGSIIAGATDSFYVALQNGTYSVQITDQYGCNAVSSGLEVGVDEWSGGAGVVIYPNPAISQLSVYGLGFGVKASIAVFDVVGNKVFVQQLLTPDAKPQTFDISGLENGVYLLQIEEAGRMVNKPFIVVKR